MSTATLPNVHRYTFTRPVKDYYGNTSETTVSATRFHSFEDAIQTALSDSTTWPGVTGTSRTTRGSSHWDMYAGWSGACDLLTKGWPDGCALVGKVSASVSRVTGRAVRNARISYEVAGDFVDVARYCAGDPENMGTFRLPRPKQGRIVRILCGQSASAGVSGDALARRGAAAVALVDALEKAGRQCEVIMDCGSRRGDRAMSIQYPLKKAGERMELDRLAFIMAHPASFRRIGFSLCEHESQELRSTFGYYTHGSYGMPQGPISENENDILIPEMLYTADEAGLIRWVLEQLKAQGVEINE